MSSLNKRIRELEGLVEDIIGGAFPQRSALGPGTVSKNFLKAKSITSSMLDVSELASVSSNTGTLSVTGALTAGSGSTSMGFSPTDGLYIGNATPGSAPFRVATNGAVTATNATVSGSVSATSLTANTSGSIGGWSISSSQLSTGTGSSTRGVSTGSVAFYAGNATPGSAPFRVTSGGAMTAESGSIGGWTISSSALSLGSGSSARGMDSGSTSFYAGSSTPSSAPFRVTSGGALTATNATITGAITATSGSFTGSVTTSTLDANGGTMGGLTIDGTLDVSTGGVIKSGASSATVGTGYWLAGGTTPVFRVGTGTSGSSYLYWNGTSLTVKGRLEFGTGDYLENDLLHFQVGTTATKVVEATGSGVNPVVHLNAHANSFGSRIEIQARESAASGGGQATIAAVSSTSDEGYWELRSYDQAGSDYIGVTGNFVQDGKLALYNRNTGTGADVEVQLGGTGGSEVFEVVDSTNNRLFAIASNGAIIIDSHATNGPLFLSGASGALPNPTKYLVIRDGDNDSDRYYIPVYAAANSWAA